MFQLHATNSTLEFNLTDTLQDGEMIDLYYQADQTG